MNIYQRIVLIVGATFLLLLVVYILDMPIHPYTAIKALVTGILIVGATLLIFIAFKDIKKKINM